jgi:hypothetical protein
VGQLYSLLIPKPITGEFTVKANSTSSVVKGEFQPALQIDPKRESNDDEVSRSEF